MKRLIIALTAVLSARGASPTAAAEGGHIMLVGMSAPVAEGPARVNSASAAATAVSRVTHSAPPLSIRNPVPASLRKLDFRDSHAAQHLGRQGFDWTPGATGK